MPNQDRARRLTLPVPILELESAYHAAPVVFHVLDLHAGPIVAGRGCPFTEILITGPTVDRLASIVPNTPAWYADQVHRLMPTAARA